MNDSSTSDTPSELQENSISLNEKAHEPLKQSGVSDNNEQKSGQIDASEDKNPAKLPNSQGIPETVANRYLRIEDKYYFPDKSIAFEDRGNKLKLATENQSVIRDALAIAEARGWQSITVSGSQNFKHQVWREASIKGMDVAGYQPTDLEMAELNHAMTLRDARKQGSDHPKPKGENAQQPNDGVLRGTLLAHGEDYYRHDPKQEKSYFVKLDVEGKEVTRWGVDLPRAFAESPSQPQIGDKVALSNLGQQAVSIKVTAMDDQGNPVEEIKTVKKNRWLIEKASRPDPLQEHAEALRAGNEIEHKVIEQLPQLAAAIAVAKLGEKIAQHAKESGALKSQDEVDIMVKLIREGLAAALEKGKHIKTPEIQEQGKQAAVDANSIMNDHKPPEMVKDPQHQELIMTR
jgi:hypothetical protein